MSFDTWWYQEGSGIIPKGKEDMEEFAKRISHIAWSNGAYIEREACAQICDSYAENSSSPMNFAENCAQTIRQRGKK